MNIRRLSSMALVLVALPAVAQVQTGGLMGKVAGKDGKPLAGVRVEAASSVLPQPRRVMTAENGEYRMPFLPPGDYVLTFTHPSLATEKRAVPVALQQNSTVNVAMREAAQAGAQVEVVAQTTMVDATSTELRTAINSDVMAALPVGQDYRDLVKLIPGVMQTQDAIRAPSAGGSGQDNVHQFDGVNVNLPLFGTMSSTPAGHDIDQITIVKGGADATGFNRSAGYTLNSISKSGTNYFTGELSYQVLPDKLVERKASSSALTYEQGKAYTIANIGGPIIQDRLFFFGSIYRPTVGQKNSANAYGTIPDYSSTREEYFGKLTYAPLSNLIIHGSYRDSRERYYHAGYSGAVAPTTGTGGLGTMKIGILEATWNPTANSFVNFKTTNFINKTNDRPDYQSTAVPSFSTSATLNVAALATQGLLRVPTPQTTTGTAQTAYNAFIAPIITQYGYLDSTGTPTGGGLVGGTSQINNQDFFRRDYQLSYDVTLGSAVTHQVHVGAQWFKDMEDLYRTSNGWGSITVPYNTFVPTGLPNAGAQVYFQAAVQQQGVLSVPVIHSEYEAVNIEINDKIRWRSFTFNVGAVVSNDKLYGQGLAEDPTSLSGWVLAKGNKYLEKEIKPADTLQPRLGITWNYAGEDTVYANYARFVPSASSLPRAASWARNLAATVNVYFNQAGQYLANQVEASSTGKLYAPGIKPRHTDEYLIGTTKDLGQGWSGRAYARYRYSCNFWEDTMNNSRVLFNPPAGIPRTLYIPNLGNMLATLGGGSDASFVVAQLDNSFTKYYEAGLEAEWKGQDAYLNFSYSWSHYYGNFDQDSTTTSLGNDSNIFIGSSNIADDFGKQLWNNKYGNLTGDRRHKLKLFGYFNLPWSARLGAYFVYQSGQPWQYSDYKAYPDDRLAQGSTSTSDTNRYAEPAGSRTTSPHYQLDLNYTQIFYVEGRNRLEGMFDVYNLFNKQTGYNIQTARNSALPGTPQTLWLPRRLQLGIRFLF